MKFKNAKRIFFDEKHSLKMKEALEDIQGDDLLYHRYDAVSDMLANKTMLEIEEEGIRRDALMEKFEESIQNVKTLYRGNSKSFSNDFEQFYGGEQENILAKTSIKNMYDESFTQNGNPHFKDFIRIKSEINEQARENIKRNFEKERKIVQEERDFFENSSESNKVETSEIVTEPKVGVEKTEHNVLVEYPNGQDIQYKRTTQVPLKPFAVDMLPEYQSNLNKKTEALEGIIINEENMPKLLDNNNVKGAEIDNTPIYLQNAIELVPPSEPIKEVTHNTPALYNTELDVGNNKNGVLAYIKNEVKKLTFSETPFPNNNILALPGSSKLLPNMKKPEIPLLKAPDNMENNQENIQPDMKNKEPEHNPISDHDKKIEEPDEEKMWHQKTVNAPFDSAVNALKNFDFDNPLNSKNQEIMSNINNGIDGIMNQFNNPELVALMRASHGQKYGLSNEESRDILYGTSVGDLFRKGYEEGDRLQARDAYKNKLSEIQEQSARQGNTWSNNISEIFKMASPLNFIMPTSAAFALLKSTGTTFKMLGEAVSNKAYKNKIDEAYGARIKAELGKMGFNVTDHDAKMIAKEERKRNFGFNLKNINNNIQAWNPIMNINPFSENFGEKYDASKMLGGVFPGLKTSEHLLSPKNNKTLMKLLQGSSQGLYDDSLKLGEHKDAIDKFENIFVEKLDDKGIEYQAKKDESYTLIRNLSADELSENDKYNFIDLIQKKDKKGLTVEENESYNSFYQKLNKNTIANLDKINKSATKISAEINILKDGAEQAGIKIDDENNKIYGYTNKLNEFHEKNNGFVETAQNIGNKITGIKSGTHDLNVNDDSIGHQPDTQTKNPNVDTNLNNEAEKKPDEEQNKKPKKSKDPSPDF